MIEDREELFIRQNREAFDNESPPLDLWAKIERSLPADTAATHTAAVRKIFSFNAWQGIAAALALLVTGAVLFMVLQRGVKKTEVNPESQQLTLAEDFYQKQVNEKTAILAAYHPDPAVMEDLQQMDAVESELRAELAKAPTSSREEIIENLIQTYKNKLDILEKVLEKVQENDLSANKNLQNDTI